MKYILGFFHTMYFQLAVIFGWKVYGKTLYLLCPVFGFKSGACFESCEIHWLGKNGGWIFFKRKKGQESQECHFYDNDN